MSFEGYLSQDEITRLAAAANAVEPISNEMQRYMIDPLPAQFKGNFSIPPIAPVPQTRMLANRLNSIRSLDNGQIPIEVYVSQIAQNNSDKETAGFFAGLLDKIKPPVAVENLPNGTDAVARDPVTSNILREAIVGGRNDMQSIKFLKRGMRAAASIFKLVISRHFGGTLQEIDGETIRSAGTGWVIADGIGITNYHVFEARNRMQGDAPAEPEDIKLQFQTAKLSQELEEPHIQDVIGDARWLYADPDRDFVLFELPPALAGLPPMSVRNLVLKKGPTHPLLQRVNVLQHPGGGDLRMAIRNNFVVRGTDTVLTYLSDTQEGSSGGAVCDDNWQARALHLGSRPVPEGPIQALDTIITKENVGLPVTAVSEAVKAADSALGERLVASWI